VDIKSDKNCLEPMVLIGGMGIRDIPKLLIWFLIQFSYIEIIIEINF
jgi:hypothetical protein